MEEKRVVAIKLMGEGFRIFTAKHFFALPGAWFGFGFPGDDVGIFHNGNDHGVFIVEEHGERGPNVMGEPVGCWRFHTYLRRGFYPPWMKLASVTSEPVEAFALGALRPEGRIAKASSAFPGAAGSRPGRHSSA